MEGGLSLSHTADFGLTEACVVLALDFQLQLQLQITICAFTSPFALPYLAYFSVLRSLVLF